MYPAFFADSADMPNPNLVILCCSANSFCLSIYSFTPIANKVNPAVTGFIARRIKANGFNTRLNTLDSPPSPVESFVTELAIPANGPIVFVSATGSLGRNDNSGIICIAIPAKLIACPIFPPTIDPTPINPIPANEVAIPLLAFSATPPSCIYLTPPTMPPRLYPLIMPPEFLCANAACPILKYLL